MAGLPEIGTEVRYIGRPDGERSFGTFPHDKWHASREEREKHISWVVGGARGKVVKLHPGSPSIGRCPNHDDFPDCICANETGVDRGIEPWAVVAWETNGGPEPTLERCIEAGDQGTEWELA